MLKNNADLLLAIDCDRIGIAIKYKDDGYKHLSGNKKGMLLFDYVCSRRTSLGKIPKDPVMVKAIVTICMA